MTNEELAAELPAKEWYDRATAAEQRLYDTIIAAMGGEDVPGSAMSVMPADVERAMRDRDEAFNYERDRATAAEQRVKALEEAVRSVQSATCAYLPPDGIDAKECISRVLAATDNPTINAAMGR